MSSNPLVKQTRRLNDGTDIPVLGIGVFKIDNDITCGVVSDAIGAGIRLIDTAQAYNNEEGVAAGIAHSGVPRNQLYITTKVWNGAHGYDSTLQCVKESLAKLQTTYLDMLLIHWPQPMKNLFVETYKAMEILQKDGFVRSIGLSNFQAYHIDALMQSCNVMPAINQIELHPYLLNTEVTDYCKQKGIAVQAWSPIARGALLDDKTAVGIAQKLGKSPAQVVLRWHYQHDNLTIPKSVHLSRTIENASIFDSFFRYPLAASTHSSAKSFRGYS